MDADESNRDLCSVIRATEDGIVIVLISEFLYLLPDVH